ncbi:MAG: hypothetical protein JKY89_13290 [Immundisolibacteraceae bacterium]|nr:hypothetical protein [Immundisolibacteraceae bacterium]
MSREIVTPTLTASLDVECPYCGEWFDLFDGDDDHIYQGAIFGNRWEDLEGDKHHCPKCEAELTIDTVDY